MKLSEGSYSRVLTILRGLVPSVRTLAFITAENPLGKSTSPEENNRRNAELQGDLKGYGYNKIKGFFEGNAEHSFFVVNISLDYLIKLSRKYEQQAFIFGYKDSKKEGLVFDYYDLSDDQYSVTGEQKVFVTNDPNAFQPYYSEYKGRKFVVPLFNPKYDEAEFLGGSIIKKENLPNTDDVNFIIEDLEKQTDWFLGVTDEEWQTGKGRTGTSAGYGRMKLYSNLDKLSKYNK